jgi:hypothetical protein
VQTHDLKQLEHISNLIILIFFTLYHVFIVNFMAENKISLRQRSTLSVSDNDKWFNDKVNEKKITDLVFHQTVIALCASNFFLFLLSSVGKTKHVYFFTYYTCHSTICLFIFLWIGQMSTPTQLNQTRYWLLHACEILTEHFSMVHHINKEWHY